MKVQIQKTTVEEVEVLDEAKIFYHSGLYIIPSCEDFDTMMFDQIAKDNQSKYTREELAEIDRVSNLICKRLDA